jgi:hypothetical protein
MISRNHHSTKGKQQRKGGRRVFGQDVPPFSTVNWSINPNFSSKTVKGKRRKRSKSLDVLTANSRQKDSVAKKSNPPQKKEPAAVK